MQDGSLLDLVLDQVWRDYCLSAGCTLVIAGAGTTIYRALKFQGYEHA